MSNTTTTKEATKKPRLPIIVPRSRPSLPKINPMEASVKVIDAIENNQSYHHVGTSGYSYEHWTSSTFREYEGFYPPNVGKNHMFDFYAKHFDFLELNTTFYGNPSEETMKNWYTSSPPNFRFLVKANKYITHSKKLLNFDETFPRFVNLVSLLKEKCLGILLQLPPMFKNDKRNFDRLRAAGLLLKNKSIQNPYNYQIFIEFRDPRWFCQSVYDMLKEIGFSLTVVNLNNDCGSFGKMDPATLPSTLSSASASSTSSTQSSDKFLTESVTAAVTAVNNGDVLSLLNMLSNMDGKEYQQLGNFCPKKKVGFFPDLEEIRNGNAVTVPNTIMFRCHGTYSCGPYMGNYSDEDLMMMASISLSHKRGLICFDNTDSFQYQMEAPWMKTERGTSQLVFDRNLIHDNVKRILPHAIEDALKVKKLL